MERPAVIPFTVPYVDEKELTSVCEALRRRVLRGDGEFGREVQRRLREWLDVRHVLLTTSCTHALEMAMMALDIEPGDEVIMPSFTFVSTANAVVLRGGVPVFADIEPGTLNLDPADVEHRITARTRAIVPVHYGGVACDMDAMIAIARRHGLSVVEDAAQAVDAYYRGKPLGTIGDIGCYSFHDTKNITCGEGGAFLTNRDDIAAKAELMREKGTNRLAYLRGEVDKYTWVSSGSSYVQSEVLAALLSAQLSRRIEIKQKRRKVWMAYYEALSSVAASGLIELPVVPDYCEPNYHIFHFNVQSASTRNAVIDYLHTSGIQATFHYVPLHSSPFGRQFAVDAHLPNTHRYSDTIIRLPLYPDLADRMDVVRRIVDQVTDAVESVSPTMAGAFTANASPVLAGD